MLLRARLLALLGLLLPVPAGGADVTVTPGAGDAFVVTDHTGAIVRLRVEEATGLVLLGSESSIQSPLPDPFGEGGDRVKVSSIDPVHWGTPYRCSWQTLGGNGPDNACDEPGDCPSGECIPAGSGTPPTTALSTTRWITSYQDNASTAWERTDAIRSICYNTDASTNQAFDPSQHAFCDTVEADYQDDAGTGGISQIEWYRRAWYPNFSPAGGIRVLSNTVYLGSYLASKFGSYSGDYNQNLLPDSGEYAFVCGGTVNGCTFGSSSSPLAYVYTDPSGGRSTYGVHIAAGGSQTGAIAIERPASSSFGSLFFFTSGGSATRLWSDDNGDFLRVRRGPGGPANESDGAAVVTGSQAADWGPLLGGVADADGSCDASADATPSCGSELCSNGGMACTDSDVMGGDGSATDCSTQHGSGANFWAICR